MTNEQKLEVLKAFCDTTNKKMATPFKWGDSDKIYATEGHILVITSGQTDDVGYYNIGTVYTPSDAPYYPYCTKELQDLISKFELIDEIIYEDCDVCHGDGQVEWEFESYTKFNECPKCNGHGDVKRRTGKKVPDFDSCCFEFESVFINPEFVHLLIEKIGAENDLLIQVGKDRMFFKLGEFEGVIMNMTIPGKEIIKINKKP